MPKKVESKIVLPFVPENARLTEQFKGQTETKDIQFPKEVGEEHTTDFNFLEDLYIKDGFVQAVVEKHLDYMFPKDFTVESKDDKAKEIINSFIKENRLIIRSWLREGLLKGNGFCEIGNKKNEMEIKLVNANNMYVKRKKNGEIVGYNQWMGYGKRLQMTKPIEFNKNEIAHLKINQIGDYAYGLGIIYPGLLRLEYLARSDKDMHLLISRKANSPIIATLGSPEEPASQGDVTAMGTNLIYLTNLHEWAVSHQVKFEVLDFGNLGEKFATVIEHDKEMLFYIFQIPPVIMGLANVPEGLASVQQSGFDRRIQSLRTIAEYDIEQQIFKPLLRLNGLDADVEIIWSQPSEESKNERIMKLTSLLQNSMLSPVLRAMAERDIANELGYEEDLDYLTDPKEAEQKALEKQKQDMNIQVQGQNNFGNKERNKEETQIGQPEIPGQKINLSQSEQKKLIEMAENDLSLRNFTNIVEIPGFNYQEYLTKVIQAVETDNFDDLRAVTEEDVQNGLLTDTQISNLRAIFKHSFINNFSIREIENVINKELNLKDRIVEDRLVLSGPERANVIARTESVRLANQGLVDMYKENGIQEVRWLASISDRTCPDCEALNGQVFNLNELSVGVNQPPLHVNCRCSLLSIKS